MNDPSKPTLPLVATGLGLFVLWAVAAFIGGRDPVFILLQVVGMVLGVGLLRVFVTARRKHLAWGWHLVIILGSCVAVVGVVWASRAGIDYAARLGGYALGYSLIPSVGLATMYSGLYPQPRDTQSVT